MNSTFGPLRIDALHATSIRVEICVVIDYRGGMYRCTHIHYVGVFFWLPSSPTQTYRSCIFSGLANEVLAPNSSNNTLKKRKKEERGATLISLAKK